MESHILSKYLEHFVVHYKFYQCMFFILIFLFLIGFSCYLIRFLLLSNSLHSIIYITSQEAGIVN